MGLARARWERARGRPEEDAGRLDALDDLADALQNSREYAAALPLKEEALEIDRRISGDLHITTLTSMYNLALLHVVMGNLSLALPLAEECLRGRQQTQGDEHEHTLKSMLQLSIVHRDMRRRSLPRPVTSWIFADCSGDIVFSWAQLCAVCTIDRVDSSSATRDFSSLFSEPSGHVCLTSVKLINLARGH